MPLGGKSLPLFSRNTAFFLEEVKESESCTVVSNSLQPHGPYSPWNSPGQNTGVGCFSLLQGIFPTQGLNPGLLHCRWILYQLHHKESPRILAWVAYPFYSRSSWPRNQTWVSCISGRLFTNWAMREALFWKRLILKNFLIVVKATQHVFNCMIQWHQAHSHCWASLTNIHLLNFSAILLGIDPEKNHSSKGYMHPSIHCSTVYSSQDMAAT